MKHRRAGNKAKRRKNRQKAEKEWLPSIVIFGIEKPGELRDTFLLQDKVGRLGLEVHDAFMNVQGTVRLLFQTLAELDKALTKTRTAEWQAQLREKFGAEARAERGHSRHKIAFLRVPQKDSKDGFKRHLERLGFTVEHIQYRGQEGRRTHTRIVTVREGDKAKQAIKDGEVRMGPVVRYKVGEAHEKLARIQCFRCQQYHDTIAKFCEREVACRKCGARGAHGHATRDCTAPPHVRRCVLCDGAHAAGAFVCPKRPKTFRELQREREQQRREQAKQGRQKNQRNHQNAWEKPLVFRPARQNAPDVVVRHRTEPRPQLGGAREDAAQAPPQLQGVRRAAPQPVHDRPVGEARGQQNEPVVRKQAQSIAPQPERRNAAQAQAQKPAPEPQDSVGKLLRKIARVLIEHQRSEALELLYANSQDLDIHETYVSVLEEEVETIPKQGRKKNTQKRKQNKEQKRKRARPQKRKERQRNGSAGTPETHLCRHQKSQHRRKRGKNQAHQYRHRYPCRWET